jgi:calreticulin
MKEFSNKGKDLVIQYTVKHEQDLDCGGGYLKLLPAPLDQINFTGDSEYNIMFGPDQCGGTKRVHFILTYKGKNHLIEDDVNYSPDELSHVYTLILHPDQTFKVLVDNEEKRSGSLTKDFSFLPPKEILDPQAKKPADWVDDEYMDDPEDKKPADWDSVPESIADPNAKKPDDWDEELDGAWEAPMITNPDWKGAWKAKRIKNSAYQGKWEHPKIANPKYYEDSEIYAFKSHAYLGIEIWQVKAGSIFDNFLVTDDVKLAEKRAAALLEGFKIEKEVKEKADETDRATKKDSADEEGEADEDVEFGGEDEHAGHDHDHDEL